jgi:hypothetical protein
MYFDAESREIERQGTRDDDEHAARALQLQLQLCRAINDFQTFGGRNDRLAATLDGRVGASGQRGGGEGSAEEEVGLRMVALPVNQETASVTSAESRGDLGNLWHMCMENMCTAIGVPSALLFEGRFSGQSSAQLALLNSTVQQLGRRVDSVLTDVFNDIYDDEMKDEDEDEDDGEDGGEADMDQGHMGMDWKVVPTPSQQNAGVAHSFDSSATRPAFDGGEEDARTKGEPSSAASGGKRGRGGDGGESGADGKSGKSGKGGKGGKGKRWSRSTVTAAFRGVELVTTAAPISAAAEVMSLFSGGLADFEAAAPLALHAVGLSASEIAAAMERHSALEVKLERERKVAEQIAMKEATAAANGGGGGSGGGSGGKGGGKSSSATATGPPPTAAATAATRGATSLR